MTIWDDPDLQAGGEFFRFDHIGDSVSGRIDVIRSHRFDNGKVAPQLLITTDQGEERTVTAGQIKLKTELVRLRPNPGDHITITFTGEEPRPGGKTLRHFTVEVRPGQAPQPGGFTQARQAYQPQQQPYQPAQQATAPLQPIYRDQPPAQQPAPAAQPPMFTPQAQPPAAGRPW